MVQGAVRDGAAEAGGVVAGAGLEDGAAVGEAATEETGDGWADGAGAEAGLGERREGVGRRDTEGCGEERRGAETAGTLDTEPPGGWTGVQKWTASGLTAPSPAIRAAKWILVKSIGGPPGFR